jgi:hypothetical protein
MPRTFWQRLLLLALLGLAVRVGHVVLVLDNDELHGDAFYYHTAANLLADGKGFIDPYRYVYGGAQELLVFPDADIEPTAANTLPPGHEEPTAGHPPAWTVLLAAFSRLGLRSVLAHQLVSAAVGAVAVVVMGVAGRELGRAVWGDARRAERLGLVAATISAGYVCLWINDGLVMSETAVAVMVPACTWAALRFARDPSLRHAAVLGVLGGLAPLTRAELAFFLPVVAALALWRAPLSWRARAGRYALCGAAALLVVGPWVVRNLRAFEEPVLLSNGFGTVLVQTNCDATYHGEKLGYWELYCGLPQPLGPDGEPLDESQRDAVLRRRALDYIGDNTRRLVTVAVPARVGRMFAVYDPVQTLRFDVLVEGRSFRLSALGLAQYYVLATAAVAGAVMLARRRAPLAPLLVWPALVLVTAVLSFGNNRYRVSAEPAIVLLAAFAFVALLDRSRGDRRPESRCL